MIATFACQCGETLALYATPGAMTRCWKCRRRVHIVGDGDGLRARQEITATLVGRAPGYIGHCML